MAKQQDIQSERTWLSIAGGFLLGGAGLIAAADPPRFCDPALYLGAVSFLLGCWVLVGVFITPRVLPKLPSERSADLRHREVNLFVLEGQGIEAYPVQDAKHWDRMLSWHEQWAERVAIWLGENESVALAEHFRIPRGLLDVSWTGSFNQEHNELLTRIKRQNEILRELL